MKRGKRVYRLGYEGVDGTGCKREFASRSTRDAVEAELDAAGLQFCRLTKREWDSPTFRNDIEVVDDIP